MDDITYFTIRHYHGKNNGSITLALERFFERRPSGRFIHTNKRNIYKIFKYVRDWCDENDVAFLMKWLSEHACEDLVTYYKTKY